MQVDEKLIEQAMDAYKKGDFLTAESVFKRVFKNSKEFHPGKIFFGICKLQLGKQGEGRIILRDVLAHQPDDVQLLHMLAQLYVDDKAFCEECWLKLTQLQPNNIEAIFSLGELLRQRSKLTQAEKYFRQALDLDETNIRALNGLGVVLLTKGKISESEIYFEKVVAFQPEIVSSYLNLAKAKLYSHKFSEAQVALRKAISLDADSAYAHTQLAFSLLWDGQFEEGWTEYEWRWEIPEFTEAKREFDCPKWDGSSLNGKTILLHGEQGYGDTFQFVRYAEELALSAKEVILECKRELFDIFSTIPNVKRCVKRGDPLPLADYHAPLMSLPFLCKTTVSTIPQNVPYISLPQNIIPMELEGVGLKVGYVWRGRSETPGNPPRGFSFKNLETLLRSEGMTFFRLNKEEMSEDEGCVCEGVVENIGPTFKSFLDTVKAISSLDVIVSVDTGVAHLAGAMGKPVYLLLNKGGDWRWLHKRHDSPWYPTMKIVTNEHGDEIAMISDLAQMLRKRQTRA